MNAYPKYNESGVKWIGDIPINWNTVRAKYVYGEIKDRSEEGDETLLSVSEYYGIKPREKVIDEGDFLSRAESLEGYKKCKKNDLIMNIMLAWKRSLGVSEWDGIVSPSYSIFRVNSDDEFFPKYLHYLLRTDLYTSEFRRNSTGIIESRLRLYPEEFLRIRIIKPSLSEQKLITKFLDDKTKKIDTLIEKKQKMIELLKEERSAIINQTVTRGLDLNIEMKDSGIEWLGKIPEHWEMKKLKRICYMKGRIGWQGLRQSEFTGNGPYLITGMNFKDGVIRWDEVYHITEERYNQAPEIQLKLHDVLMTKDGTIGKLLYVDYLPRKTSLNSHLLVLRPLKNDFIPKYLYYTLNSQPFKVHIETHKTGTTFFGITQEAVGLFKMILPPVNEQRKIVEFIEKETNRIDETTFKIAKEIELLEEYRTALISEVVTGKIDVRNEV